MGWPTTSGNIKVAGVYCAAHRQRIQIWRTVTRLRHRGQRRVPYAGALFGDGGSGTIRIGRADSIGASDWLM